MIIQAELRRKQSEYEGEPCAVDKVIELPSPRFQQFSRALLADYDFIAENKNAIRHDGDTSHCLLILDADGTDGFLVDPQGYNYARYSAFVPNARSLLTPNMGVDRSYLSPAEPWRNENRDEMLRMTLRVEGKPDYTLVLPADEEYLDAVKNYLDIDAFADAMLCDIRFKVPYIGELIRDTDCPAVEDYNDFAEALEGIWQQDGALLTYAAVLEAENPETLHRACELLRNLDMRLSVLRGGSRKSDRGAGQCLSGGGAAPFSPVSSSTASVKLLPKNSMTKSMGAPPLLWLCLYHLFPRTVKLSCRFQRYSFPARVSCSPCDCRKETRSAWFARSICSWV